MPQMPGQLLLGIASGLQQARARDESRMLDMEQKKNMLKLEQDKLKLMEREVEMTGQSKIYDALARVSSAEAERVKASRPQRETLAPGSTLMQESAEPGIWGEVYQAPYTPQQRGAGGANNELKEKRLADEFIRSAASVGIKINPLDALRMATSRDRQSFQSGILNTITATAAQLAAVGQPPQPGFETATDQILKHMTNLWDNLNPSGPPKADPKADILNFDPLPDWMPQE